MPDEPTPSKDRHRAVGSQLPLYGVTAWSDLFNARQKLALLTFAEKVREAYERILEGTPLSVPNTISVFSVGQEPSHPNFSVGQEPDPPIGVFGLPKSVSEGASPDAPKFDEFGSAGAEPSEDNEFAKAVATYLALAVDRLVDYNSSLCVWHTPKELIAHTFGRQALPMVRDYFEVNPFSHSTGNWCESFDYLVRVLSYCTQIPIQSAEVLQGSALHLPYPDRFFDAVITDPPYYDNVPYSDLSDFFYVWLKRTVGDLYPDLFMSPLTPKSDELVADTVRRGGSMEAAKAWFEQMLTQAFREIARVLKDDGIAVIVFAHKSVEAWDRETLIGIVIFGVLVMIADIFSDWNWHFTAALLRIIGVVALFLLFGLDAWFRFRRQPLPIPVLFTTETDRQTARQMFETFVLTQRLPVKPIEQITSLRQNDLVICLDHNPRNQPDPQNPQHWERAWSELLHKWEREIDSRLKRDLPAGETFCYHIHPHLWVPLSFAMGASVGLRRSIVLYHRQQDRFFHVLDLTNSRCLFDEPDLSGSSFPT